MSAYETFSNRWRKQEQGSQPEVYRYDEIPAKVRVQIIHIWRDAIGTLGQTEDGVPLTQTPSFVWRRIAQTLEREEGILNLMLEQSAVSVQEAIEAYFQRADSNAALDITEIVFREIDSFPRPGISGKTERLPYYRKISPDEAISELNARLRNHGIGYRFVAHQIIRADSEYLHNDAIKPALALLQAPQFSGAEQEFRSAYKHYLEGDKKAAIVDALKAFESTLKVICKAHGWKCEPNATANTLLAVVFEHALIPPYLTAHFSALRATLESGLTTLRNKTSAHGQGAVPQDLPDFLVTYALHLMASNILLLVSAHEALLDSA